MIAIDGAAVAATFRLGQPLAEPEAVEGGGVHRLWRLRTTNGSYAIKAS